MPASSLPLTMGPRVHLSVRRYFTMITTPTRKSAEHFTTSEGLRRVLTRLHQQGAGAWERDPVAAELMRFAANKYAALARKHGLDPWEAASAAFEVMRAGATRRAQDPWAVVTRGVQITCIAEERGQGLLCSTNKARRPQFSALHDPERISDRENPLSDYHPAFRVTDNIEVDDVPEPGRAYEPFPAESSARAAISDAVRLFTLLDWPEAVAKLAIDRVCEATEKAGSRASAYELLRRDKHALLLLDLPVHSWSALLLVILGNTNSTLQATGAGRGILMRLLMGETLYSLLHDEDLVLQIALAAPRRRR